MAYCKNCGSEAGPKRNQHVKLRRYTCRRNAGSSYSEGYDFTPLIPDVTDYTNYNTYDSGSYDSGYSSSYSSDSGGYSSDSSSNSSSYDSGSSYSGE